MQSSNSRRAATRAACAVAIGVSVAATSAFAQDAIIEVDAPEDATAAPGEFVIGVERLDFNAPTTIGDVFAGESAVKVGGVKASSAKLYVHGFEEQNLHVSVDGVRQGSGGWHHTGNLIIDPELLKAVTVKPGVASAEDGFAALAGVLKYETKDARDLLEPGDDFGGYAKLDWSSNGHAFKKSGSVYGQIESMEYVLFGSRHDGGDYEDGNGDAVENSGPEASAFLGKVALTGEGGDRFETSFEFVEDTGERDFRNNFESIGGGAPFAPNAVVPSQTRRSTFTLSYVDEIPEGWLTPSAHFGFNRTTFNTDQPAGGGALDLQAETISYTGKINGDLDVPLGVLSVGVDFAHDESRGGGANSTITPPVFATNTPEYTETRKNLGAYAQAKLEDPSAVFALSFGGRVDQQWFTGASGEDFSDAGLSGNVTLEAKPIEGLTLSAGYSHVWGGYTFGEAALLGFVPFQPTGVVPDYTGFKVSTSDNFRIGGEIEVDGFTAGAFLFYTEIDDANGRSGVTRGESADLVSKGIDAHVGYRFEDGFITGKYTYADVTEDGDHPEPNNYYQVSPGGHLFAIQAGYKPTPTFTLGADAEIALEYDGYEAVGGEVLPGYAVLNIFAEYQFETMPGLTLRADLDNITDEDYFRHNADGAGSSAATPTLEAGRSFGLSAKVEF